MPTVDPQEVVDDGLHLGDLLGVGLSRAAGDGAVGVARSDDVADAVLVLAQLGECLPQVGNLISLFLALDQHVINICFNVPSELVLEDFLDELLVGCFSVLQAEGYHLVTVTTRKIENCENKLRGLSEELSSLSACEDFLQGISEEFSLLEFYEHLARTCPRYVLFNLT